jgi:hypothetical protein
VPIDEGYYSYPLDVWTLSDEPEPKRLTPLDDKPLAKKIPEIRIPVPPVVEAARTPIGATPAAEAPATPATPATPSVRTPWLPTLTPEQQGIPAPGQSHTQDV